MAEQLQDKLKQMYEKQNTPRLLRKTFYLERARVNEEAKNDEAYMRSSRQEYYSHRLHVLITTLESRGVHLKDIKPSSRKD